MWKAWYALAVLLVAAPARAQEEGMTIARLFQIVGERSAAATSGFIAARVTEYRCLKEGDATTEAYDRAVSEIMAALDSAPSGAPVDPAQLTPDRADWAVDTWYEIEYAYDKGRYRLIRVTPSGSYHTAYDGVASFRAEQRTLYIEPEAKPRPSMEDIDINLMRWDQIPPDLYVRADQDGGVKQLAETRFNCWLRNKKTGDTVDQIFNIETGMIERGSARNAQGQLLQEYLWLRPVMSAVWVPSAFVKMERARDHVAMEVVAYTKWEVRPVADQELTIPRDAYDTVAGAALPTWREPGPAYVTAQPDGETVTPLPRRVRLQEPGIDELELTKTPTQSYVLRTVGLSLIVVAVGLIVLYWLRLRAEN